VAEVLAQGVEIDRLFGKEGSVGFAEFSAPCGFTDADPVICPIAGCSKPLGVDKGLQEIDGVMVEPLPIFGYLTAVEGQKIRGQMRSLDPGENEESALVGDQMKAFLPALSTPSDKAVSGPDVPWGGRPGQTGHRPAMGKGHVLEMFSNGLGIAQIVMLADQTVKKLLPGCSANLLQADGEQGANGAMDRTLINLDTDRRCACCQRVGKCAFGRGLLDQTPGLQEQQQAAADHVLECPIGLPPVPLPAHLLGNEPSARTRMGGDDLPDKANIRFVDTSPPIRGNDVHVRHHTRSWSGTQEGNQTSFKKTAWPEITLKTAYPYLLSLYVEFS
jgi:hypothetical protein